MTPVLASQSLSHTTAQCIVFSLSIFLTIGIGVASKSKGGDGDGDIYQKEFLKIHNHYRAKHGSPAMTLADELNEKAQVCAKHYAVKRSISEHTCNPPGTGTGENLYIIWLSGNRIANKTFVVKDSVQLWYDEIKYYDFEEPGRSTGVTGHFTQVIWKGSTKLGLGISSTNDGHTVVVGKYGPPGNIVAYDKSQYYKHYRDNVAPSSGGTRTRTRTRIWSLTWEAVVILSYILVTLHFRS